MSEDLDYYDYNFKALLWRLLSSEKLKQRTVKQSGELYYEMTAGRFRDLYYLVRVLIQELADYEKMPDGPQISAEVLEQDGFGDTRFFRCNVAQVGSELVGFTLYYYTYSTWEGKQVYMEDLYVQPSFRSQGIGTKVR